MIKKRPIGLFDSGIGGLSILKDLQQRFPNEGFVYLADQKNYPYGPKTSEQLIDIVNRATKHLLLYNLKAIVIACNTASAHSDHLNLNIPVYTIIDPIISEVKSLNLSNILLIATEATVKSGLYQKLLNDTSINLLTYPAPNLVNLVESFEFHKASSFDVVKKELNQYLNKNIEGIILGCTHFNFLKPQLNKAFPQTILIDGLEELSKNFNSNSNDVGYTKLLTTGDLKAFTTQVKGLNIDFNEIKHVSI